MSDIPEKWWVDPTYDPMQDLHNCKIEIHRMSGVINQLITANNAHDKMILDVISQNQKLLLLYKSSQEEIMKLNQELESLTKHTDST